MMKFVNRISFLTLIVLILRLLWTSSYNLETRENPCEENDSRLEEDMATIDGLLDELHAELRLLLHDVERDDEVRVSRESEKILERVKENMGKSRQAKIKDTSDKITLDVHESAWYLEAWRHWQNSIDQFQLYDPDDPVVSLMIRDMQIGPVERLQMYRTGSMFKLNITLTNDQQIMFKPMRYPRSVEQMPDQFYYVDFERHTAEIAGFHLDKILEFYRVPPTTGRFINVHTDVEEKGESILADYVYPSHEGDMCFYVSGDDNSNYDESLPICGHPTEVEGAAVAFVPPDHLEVWEYPWARTRQWNSTAAWEEDGDYCELVRGMPPYSEGRRLLDMVDMAIFDFLQGNMERDRYETFSKFGDYTYPIHMDNSQGFGKSYEDELSILAPLYQCCQVRLSTVLKLWGFYEGPQRLSDLMRASLYHDPVHPVLLERSLMALDRRVVVVLEEIGLCIHGQGRKLDDVIIDDGL